MQTSASRQLAVAFSAIAMAAVAWKVRSLAAVPEIGRAAVNVPVDALVVSARCGDDASLVSIPPHVRRLHGRRVGMAGTMSAFEPTGLTEYLFIPETKQEPCSIYCETCPLHAGILTVTPNGHTEDFQERPFMVEGVLEIDIDTEDGKVYSIYRLRDAKIVSKNYRLVNSPALVWVVCQTPLAATHIAG